MRRVPRIHDDDPGCGPGLVRRHFDPVSTGDADGHLRDPGIVLDIRLGIHVAVLRITNAKVRTEARAVGSVTPNQPAVATSAER